MKFESKMHMVQELIAGKRFANKHGDIIRYDESFPNSPFRVNHYANTDGSVPMGSEWNAIGQNIWTEVSPHSKSPVYIYTIRIMTDRGEFTKFTLDEGVELEFNHTDHTMYFRPATPLELKPSVKNEANLEPQLLEALRKIVKLEMTLKALVHDLEKAEQMNTRLRATKFMHFNDEDCWVWNSDDPNYIESLVCPIAIHKEDLLRIAANGFNGVEV
jgi:hypothetical protein